MLVRFFENEIQKGSVFCTLFAQKLFKLVLL